MRAISATNTAMPTPNVSLHCDPSMPTWRSLDTLADHQGPQPHQPCITRPFSSVPSMPASNRPQAPNASIALPTPHDTPHDPPSTSRPQRPLLGACGGGGAWPSCSISCSKLDESQSCR